MICTRYLVYIYILTYIKLGWIERFKHKPSDIP